MAWNRSDGTVGAGRGPARRGLSPSPRARRAAVSGGALLALAALAAGAWWWAARGRGDSPAGSQAPRPSPASCPSSASPAGPVPAAKPAAVGTGPSPAGRERAETAERLQPLKTNRDERGILRYEGGLRVPGQRPLAKPIELGAHQPKVFRHAAEEHLSWLLDMKIGEPVIGDYAYGEAFVRSFRESLKEPVAILDTDDARTRALKEAVQETKEDLARRMEAGEDVARIMNETMDEFRRLARYRHELQAQLHEISADAERFTDRDVEDFTKAANEMLRREGLPPLALPRAVMRGLRRR